MSDQAQTRTTFAARAFGVVADVRRGEGPTVVLLTAQVFLLLLAYYLIKTVREPLILESGGAELKAYVSAGQVLFLIPAAKGYDLLTRRFGRMRLIPLVTLFFASHLVVFFTLAKLGTPYLGFAFYIWVGVFSLMIVAQFWSFANDIYREEQGKRLFPIVAGGGAVGAVVGAYGAALLPFEPYAIMLITAGLLVASLGLTLLVHKREVRKSQVHHVGAPRPPFEVVADPPIGGKTDAFKMVLKDKFLFLIAVLTLVRQWVNTTGEYILDRVLLEHAHAGVAAGTIDSLGAYIQTFKGGFYGTVNLLELVLQFLIVSRVLKHFGLRTALFVLPICALGGHMAMALTTTLMVIAIAKMAENSLDYSLQNTIQQVLFLRPSREAKYKAKAVIDTVFWRGGDVLAAGVIFAGTTWLSFSTKHFILVNIAMLAVWIGVVYMFGNLYGYQQRRRAAAAEAEPMLAGAPDPG